MTAAEVSIGCGSAFADDHLGAGQDLADSGLVDCMAFDRLAERTMALAQMRRVEDPNSGYDQHIPEFVQRFAPFLARGGQIAGNFGAANPEAAGAAIRKELADTEAADCRVAVIQGDDVLDLVKRLDPELPERGCRLSAEPKRVVSAHAYIGAAPLLEALQAGAQLVIGGRIADPSLFVALMCHKLGWSLDELDRVAEATATAHVMECGIQAVGGMFADPPRNVVPNAHRLGMPFARGGADGFVVSKLESAGGVVNDRVVKAQLAYEILDPGAYLTPDVSADFRNITAENVGPDQVLVRGARGAAAPDTLKVLVGLELGYKVLGQCVVGGPGCMDRALLTRDSILRRIEEDLGDDLDDYRVDLVGYDALFGSEIAEREDREPLEVQVRFAAAAPTRAIGDEAGMAFWNSTWAAVGCGGHGYSVSHWVGVTPCFVPRDAVETHWYFA